MEWTDTCGIHHWRTLRSIYRKLVWVGFKSMKTEFQLDALTNWGIRSGHEVSAVRAIFVQLLHFHLLFSVQIALLPSSVAIFILTEILHRLSHQGSRMNWYTLFTTEGRRSSYISFAWLGFEHTTTKLNQLALSQFCTASPDMWDRD